MAGRGPSWTRLLPQAVAILVLVGAGAAERPTNLHAAGTVGVHTFVKWDDAEDPGYAVRMCKAAVFSVEFDQPLYVNFSSWLHAQGTDGLVSLKCGNQSFPSTGEAGLHGLRPISTLPRQSLLGLLSRSISEPAVAASTFTALLALQVGSDDDAVSVNNVDEDGLTACSLQFGSALTNADGQPVLTSPSVVGLRYSRVVPSADLGSTESAWPDSAGIDVNAAMSALQVDDDMQNVVGLESQVEPMIVGLTDPLAKAAGAMVGDGVKKMHKMATTTGVVTDTLNLLVYSTAAGIAVKTTYFTMGMVAAAFKDQLPPAIAEAVRDYITVVATEEVTAKVTTALHDGLGDVVPPKVVHTAKDIVGARAMRSLGSILGKSISHSLTGAVMHSVTHNAATDYYCYMCYQQKLYCDFCSHEPRQLYYAMYYTGFYSAYYSDYYSRYFFKTAAFEVDKRREDKDKVFHHEIERLADDICPHDNCGKMGNDYPLPPNH